MTILCAVPGCPRPAIDHIVCASHCDCSDCNKPCDHGSYWTDHDGQDHCLVCPHVTQSTEPESA